MNTKMIYIILFIICVSVCWILVKYMPFKEMNPLKHVLEANNLFCIQYLIFSCYFILFESFAVSKVLICVLAFSVIFMFVLMLKGVSWKKWDYAKISRAEIVLLLVILFVILPLINITSEEIAIDTDQGAYFLHTCTLMEEKSKEIHFLQEIGKISEEVDNGIRELTNDLKCYYHEKNEDIFYIHALGSWCSYTALFGKMFGVWYSRKAVNYLYILIVLNFFYVCKKIMASKYNLYLYIVMFALSPPLLYIGKAGLSEIVILYLVGIGLNYIFQKGIFFSLISGICIGLIGYVHISMYAYIPIITGIILLRSTQRKKLAWFNIVQLIMFGFSIWYAYKISPIYVKKQYLRFTLNGKLNYFFIFVLVDLLVIIAVIIQILILKEKIKVINKIGTILFENYRKISVVIWAMIFASTVYYTYFMCFTDKFIIKDGEDAATWIVRNSYVNKGISAISHLNIVNISRAVGIIGILIFIAIPFLNHELSDITITLYYVGLYAMIIWTVLQMDTPSNYYCSRYFVPVLIPMIVLSIVSYVKSQNWCIYFIMIVLLYSHRFLPAFLMGGPKVGQYELLQDTLEVIPENAIVFCHPESHMINARLSNNLRILNDNEIYNLNNMDEVLNFYSNSNINTYIISELELEHNADLLKSKIFLSQYSFGNGRNGTYDIGVDTYEIPLFIYKVGE